MKAEEKLSCPFACYGSIFRMVDVDPFALKLDGRGEFLPQALATLPKEEEHPLTMK
jgi:hypothetical protein